MQSMKGIFLTNDEHFIYFHLFPNKGIFILEYITIIHKNRILILLFIFRNNNNKPF